MLSSPHGALHSSPTYITLCVYCVNFVLNMTFYCASFMKCRKNEFLLRSSHKSSLEAQKKVHIKVP